jgi:chlorophyll synthase
MVSILPVFVGTMLATRELLPGLDAWGALVARATSHGVSASEVGNVFVTWLGEAHAFLVAVGVMGPLVWAAALALNDAYDVAGDRLNPRKADTPLVRGIVTATFARNAGYLFAVLAMAGAATLNVTFLGLVAAFLGLAWAYSVPPLRLKARPGADVAVNAIGVGVIALLAGWAAVRPLGGFPWIMLPQGLLVATAVYVPSTLVDEEADRASGVTTMATALGRVRAYRIGWIAWVACCAGATAMAVSGTVIPRRMLPVLAVSVPVLLWEYHTLIGRARDEHAMARGIVACSLTFAATNVAFALMYTGLWR